MASRPLSLVKVTYLLLIRNLRAGQFHPVDGVLGFPLSGNGAMDCSKTLDTACCSRKVASLSRPPTVGILRHRSERGGIKSCSVVWLPTMVTVGSAVGLADAITSLYIPPQAELIQQGRIHRRTDIGNSWLRVVAIFAGCL